MSISTRSGSKRRVDTLDLLTSCTSTGIEIKREEETNSVVGSSISTRSNLKYLKETLSGFVTRSERENDCLFHNIASIIVYSIGCLTGNASEQIQQYEKIINLLLDGNHWFFHSWCI